MTSSTTQANAAKVIAIANQCGIDTDTDGEIWGSTNGALLKFARAIEAEVASGFREGRNTNPEVASRFAQGGVTSNEAAGEQEWAAVPSDEAIERAALKHVAVHARALFTDDLDYKQTEQFARLKAFATELFAPSAAQEGKQASAPGQGESK
jgi:hypothetical protein